MTLDLATARVRKKAAEAAIAEVLQNLCEELQPSNIRLDVSVSRLMHWGEDVPASIMFEVNIICEV